MSEFQELYNGVHKYEILESRLKQLVEITPMFEYVLKTIQQPNTNIEKLNQYQPEDVLHCIKEFE